MRHTERCAVANRLPSTVPALVIAALLGLLLTIPALAAGLDLNAKGRTDADHDRDAYNKPAELYSFWGLKEGMHAMDLFPGEGYTTVLMAQIVGPRGKVLAFGSYDHEHFDKKIKPMNLTNVEETVLAEPEGFGSDLTKALAKVPTASLDAVLTIRNYHDLKNPAEALAELKRVLKPGGVLGIADSRATSGRDEPNHRIADDVIIREVTAAGFTLSGTSQMLSNPKDDYSKGFW
ncbi:MAG TPA: methyltransferase domain-containing protein, partial [Candidatus Polarisedimenticolia bacterium]|nr:methyltransferase domain-containing protein [Candidatus Polarisedimenticolia bacterium]